MRGGNHEVAGSLTPADLLAAPIQRSSISASRNRFLRTATPGPVLPRTGCGG